MELHQSWDEKLEAELGKETFVQYREMRTEFVRGALRATVTDHLSAGRIILDRYRAAKMPTPKIRWVDAPEQCTAETDAANLLGRMAAELHESIQRSLSPSLAATLLFASTHSASYSLRTFLDDATHRRTRHLKNDSLSSVGAYLYFWFAHHKLNVPIRAGALEALTDWIDISRLTFAVWTGKRQVTLCRRPVSITQTADNNLLSLSFAGDQQQPAPPLSSEQSARIALSAEPARKDLTDRECAKLLGAMLGGLLGLAPPEQLWRALVWWTQHRDVFDVIVEHSNSVNEDFGSPVVTDQRTQN